MIMQKSKTVTTIQSWIIINVCDFSTNFDIFLVLKKFFLIGMESNDSFSSSLNMVIEPGQDPSSYPPAIGGPQIDPGHLGLNLSGRYPPIEPGSFMIGRKFSFFSGYFC